MLVVPLEALQSNPLAGVAAVVGEGCVLGWPAQAKRESESGRRKARIIIVSNERRPDRRAFRVGGAGRTTQPRAQGLTVLGRDRTASARRSSVISPHRARSAFTFFAQ